MGQRRRIALLGLCAVSLTMMMGSGAFTSTTPERSVSVDVVNDSDAYLSIGDELQCGVGKGNGDNNNFVRNQFADTTIDTLEITVTVPNSTSGEIRIGKKGDTEQIGPGGMTSFTFEDVGPGDSVKVQVKPPKGNTDVLGGNNEVAVDISVDATGTGVDVDMERSIDLVCTSSGASSSDDAD